jgi:3-oxoacyl-[acyl-carrier protein] reductase
VIAPTRSEARAAELDEELGARGLTAAVGDVSDAAGATELASRILREHGPVRHVIASLGPWWQEGPLHEQPAGEWDRVRAMMLDGHVHAARSWLGPLAEEGEATYTIVSGMGAHHPAPGTSLLFVACGAVLSLSRLLREGGAPDGVRVNEILIGARIERSPRPGVVASATFGEFLRAVLESERAGEVVRYSGDSLA